MTVLLDFLAGIGGGTALLITLIFLLRGPFHKYPLVLVYVAWAFVGNTALTTMDTILNGSVVGVSYSTETAGQRLYARLYFGNALAIGLFQLLLVIVLIYQALPEGSNRRSLRRVLAVMAIIAIAPPFVLFHPKFTGPGSASCYFSTDQFLSFGAALMNLALWAVLIGSKRRDPQLLKVSAGLGVIVTGAAI